MKNKLFAISKHTPTDVNIKLYKSYRNKLNSLLRISERKHYEELLNKHKSDLRKTWGVIKEVINKKKYSICPEKIKINNKLISDKMMMSQQFNKYFVNIGKNLAESINPSNASPSDYLKHSNPNSIFLKLVTQKEVNDIIKTIKLSSPGWDDISGKIVSQSYQTFLEPLTHILNLSLTTGIFPQELKIAKVLPLFKSGDTCLV